MKNVRILDPKEKRDDAVGVDEEETGVDDEEGEEEDVEEDDRHELIETEVEVDEEI